MNVAGKIVVIQTVLCGGGPLLPSGFSLVGPLLAAARAEAAAVLLHSNAEPDSSAKTLGDGPSSRVRIYWAYQSLGRAKDQAAPQGRAAVTRPIPTHCPT